MRHPSRPRPRLAAGSTRFRAVAPRSRRPPSLCWRFCCPCGNKGASAASSPPLRRDSRRRLLQLQVLQGGPAGVGGLLVFVVGGVGAVEGLAAVGAEAGAVGAAEEAGGKGQQGGVVGPAADLELVLL